LNMSNVPAGGIRSWLFILAPIRSNCQINELS
jgi:hypothetical protein